jgi:nicotinamide mononucleotide transporter
MTSLEILAVPLAFLGIWLTTKRSLWCWPVVLVSAGLYVKIFWDAQLYANMILQLLFGLFILYGWLMWLRGRGDDGMVSVVPLRRRNAAAALALTMVGAGLTGWLSSHYSDAPLPWPDAILSSFSLLAQYWTARRYAASWMLWVVVDIFYVGLFAASALWLTAGLYAAMAVLAVLGYRHWRALETAG